VAEVLQALKDAEVECEDNLPAVVFEESSSIGINLDSMGFEVFADMVKAYEKEFGEAPKGIHCTLSLDELLDRVNQVGINGLSEEEFNRLKELSK
jgi:2-oxo-4-hydroxy-4-carboxy--5-ureidoimidazoline (OHCU) decarboxylase